MRAITYSAFGGADALQVSDLPDPHIGPDVMVIEVRAAGLNPVDYKIREGYLEGLIDTQFPAVPGWDVAGVVVQAGLDAPEFQVGDEVFAYARKDTVSGGTLAERVAVPVRTAAHKPATASFEEAAAVPLTGLTALQSVRRARVGQGETVLIHGGAGGVGSFAVQLARLAGARVVATGSERNHDYLRGLGAEPLTYRDGLADRVRAVVPDGVDVVLDFAGGDSLDTTAAVMTDGGRVVSIADPRAASEFGGQYVWVRPSPEDLAELARLIDAGDLWVEVAATYGLEETAQAYRELESGHVRGKVVVTVP